MDSRIISVRRAREHNLRDVSLDLPHGKLICFTGVSGSGKSSLAFDTLFAEGQRRYLESLSSYARQFLGQLAKPDVEHVSGLSPAISIQQKTSGWNPRSTVGTITQIHDYLRVLFARVGRPHCPRCGKAIRAQSREQILARILELPEGNAVLVLAPLIRGQKGEYRDLFADLMRKGYARARVDGEVIALSEPPALARHSRHDIEVVVDRLTVSSGNRARLAEAVEQALKLGAGTLIVQPAVERATGSVSANAAVEDARRPRGLTLDASRKGRAPAARADRRGDRASESERDTGDSAGAASESLKRSKRSGGQPGDMLLSSHFACTTCDVSLEPPTPQLFSFNSPTGMCLVCVGLGETFDFDPELLVPDPKRTFLNGAVEPMRMHGKMGRWRRHIFEGVARHVGFDLKSPWRALPEKAKRALLYGLGDQHITFEWRSRGGVWRHGGTFDGALAELREKHRKASASFVREYYERFMRKAPCAACRGSRINPQAAAVRLGGKGIHEVGSMSIADARRFFAALKLNETEMRIAADAIKEIDARLGFLCDVGLEYLSLDRTAPTLSGGESQRIRLASQIGAGLTGVLYILDEPSIGLHPRDNERLLTSLKRLRDQGNTVIVVEHDEQTMRAADHIVDFGPGPGVRGGEVVAEGDMEAILKAKRSVTGRFLRGEEEIEVPKERRAVSEKAKLVTVSQATAPRRRARESSP